jgi:hypothetical protein
VRQALTLDAIRWQYLHGVADTSLVSPDTWYHDFALLSRPGNARVQLRLFADYARKAEICLLDGGHFLFESHLAAASDTIQRFFEATLS